MANKERITIVSRQKQRVKRTDKEYDAKGKIVLPGLIDCHTHLFSLAERAGEVDLRSCKSIREMQERIAEFASRKKLRKHEWLFGRGWDQDLFKDKQYPQRKDLDTVLPNNPCVLSRVCGHIAVVNSQTLERLSFLNNRPEALVPRKNGELTGIVKEMALEEIWKAVPSTNAAKLAIQLRKVLMEARRFGLAGVHCILSSNWKQELEAIKMLDEKRRLVIILSLFLPIEAIHEIEKLRNKERKSLNGKNFVVLGFKVFTDGSLGARTAALSAPYSDDAGNYGILYHSKNQITEFAKSAKKLGMILAAHAIGDRAVDQVLDAYAIAGIKKRDGFRIEHCSVVRKEFANRLSGVTLSVQPSFATSDYWIPERLGSGDKRIAYPFEFLYSQTLVVGGSDAPVESLNPLTGIISATLNPNPKERLSFAKAVALYSANAAKLSPLTKKLGRIAPGYDPSMLILNIKSEQEIEKAKVEHIMVRARLVS
ncbi:MAG: amidohydrolase family protein [Nitrososphaerota archaeon]|nr:amidohydrolase family protein [Nitrososphaerota archaeon]